MVAVVFQGKEGGVRSASGLVLGKWDNWMNNKQRGLVKHTRNRGLVEPPVGGLTL